MLVLVGLVAGLATTADAGPSADVLFDDGKRLLAKKDYARACAAFEESFKLDPAIGTQLNIGLCYEKWGKWPDAYRAYAEAARLAREANDDRFSKIRVQLERSARNVARVVIKLPADADPRVEVEIDGKRLDLAVVGDDITLDPGPHRIAARVPGKATVVEEIEVAIGDREVVELDVPRRERAPAKTPEPAGPVAEPEPEPEAEQAPEGPGRKRGRLVGGIALAVVGVGAVAASSYIALGARADYQKAEPLCPGGMCSTPEAHATTNDARDRARQMTYVFAGGVALTALGTYLIVTSKRTNDAPVTGAFVITDREALVVIGGSL